MRVLISGNCQGQALASMLGEVCPDWDLQVVQVFDMPLERLGEFEESARTSDLVVAQPVAAGYRGVNAFSTPWLRAALKPGARLVVIPVIYDASAHPFSITPPELGAPQFPYHDADALEAFLGGRSAAEHLQASSSPDYVPARLAQAMADEALVQLMVREEAAGADVRVSDVLVEHGHEGRTMHTFNHPARVVMASVANRVLAATQDPRRVAIEGDDYLSHHSYPPLPAVAAALGLDPGAVRLDDVRADGVWTTRAQYLEALFEYYRGCEAPTLRAALERGRGVLDRWHRATSQAGGRRG